MDPKTNIRPNAQFYTILKRDSGKTVFVWLRFDSEGRFSDIRYYATAKTRADAEHWISKHFAGFPPVVFKYCPRSASY